MSDTIEIKKWSTARAFAIIVLVASLGGAGYIAWSWSYFYLDAPARVGKDMTFIWQWKMYASGMKVAYEKDTYGGDTPEETLQLFVEALKSGDIALASKYYVPEKQGEVYIKLSEGKNLGNTDGYISYWEKRNEGKFLSDDVYSFSVSEDGVFMFYIRTMLNPISKKWKISEP